MPYPFKQEDMPLILDSAIAKDDLEALMVLVEPRTVFQEYPNIFDKLYAQVQEAACNGHAYAIFYAAMMMLSRGVELEREEAPRWLRRAARRGYVPAYRELGNCYLEGLGVEPDPKKAVVYWRKAAEQEDLEALALLCDAYTHGKGVRKNLKRAEAYAAQLARLKQERSKAVPDEEQDDDPGPWS